MPAPRVSVYCLLARKAPVGVIFRRGPSKQVLLVSWDTQSDTFRLGQWLKGRVYERRCDLSPSGQRLIYFAANYRPPYYTWTAISRPPFWTAVGLWPKGDAWGGGGLFKSETEVQLNHREWELSPAKGLAPPDYVRVEPLGVLSGWGEDEPICGQRLERDGWRLIQRGCKHEHGLHAPLWIEFDPPVIWAKPRPSDDWELRSVICGLGERGGAAYVMRHELIHPKSGDRLDLGRSEWADWCHNGDVVFAVGGRLLRLSPRAGATVGDARLLIDLAPFSFEEREPPEEARSWDRPLP